MERPAYSMRLPLTLTVAWAALWLAGSWWTASDLEASIQSGADHVLQEAGHPFKHVQATAAGITVALTGMVPEAALADKAADLLRSRLQLPHQWLKSQPAGALIHIQTDLRVNEKPTGWGLLAANASSAQLFGITATAEEALRVVQALRPAFSGGPELASHLEVHPSLVIETETPSSPIESAEGFNREALSLGFVAITRWGQPWQILDLSRPFEQARQQGLALGIPASLWDEEIGGVVRGIQEARASALNALMEHRRLSSQPPGHVVLAVRADTVLLKGELGSHQAEKLLREAVTRSIGTRRLVDELLHDSQRRPDDDVRKLATELPPLPSGNTARLLAVGTLEAGWRVIDLEQIDIEDANSILPGMLPNGADRRLMIGDIAAAASWVYSISSSTSAPQPTRPTSYLFLVLVGHRSLLYGAVPDQAMKAQSESAVRKRYPTLELTSKLRVDPYSVAGESPLMTLGSLPPNPGAETSGLLALALLGEEWRTKPARASLLEAGTLAQSGLLPEDFPINVLLPDVLDASPIIRAHLSLHEKSSPPGIPLQIIGPR